MSSAAAGDGSRQASPRLVLALDLEDPDRAVALAARLREHVDLVKVGLRLYLEGGNGLVRRLADDGWRIFLDLKFHDIPATVAAAVHRVSGPGIEMLTVHASGGPGMLAAAVGAAGEAGPRVIAVTVLTSLDREALGRIGWHGSPRQAVVRLAGTAVEAGCHGVVASPLEVASLRSRFGEDLRLVVPGIRPQGSPAADQARVATPGEAVAAGADDLVVGRPILEAVDPVAAAAELRRQMQEEGG